MEMEVACKVSGDHFQKTWEFGANRDCSFLQLCKAQSRSPPSHGPPHWLPLHPDKARFPETPTHLVVSKVMWSQHLINKKLI